jgi:hypothetical protein
LIVDSDKREVHWLELQADRQYQPVERSSLIAVGPVDLGRRIDWPR